VYFDKFIKFVVTSKSKFAERNILKILYEFFLQ